LTDYLKENINLKNSDKCKIAIQLANIINHLHTNGIVHKRIENSKIIIKPNCELYLLYTFTANITTEYHNICYDRFIKHSPKYMPSESLMGYDDETVQVFKTSYDIWSVGCVIYELFSGEQPWKSKFKDENRILLNLQKQVKFDFSDMKCDFPYNKKISFDTTYPEIFKLCNKCLLHDESKRITIKEVLNELIILEKNYRDLGN